MRRIKLKTPLKDTVAKKGMGIHNGVKARRTSIRRANSHGQRRS